MQKKAFKYLIVLYTVFSSALVIAQTDSLRVYNCDTSVSAQTKLQIQDRASTEGAVIESPELITLPNGLKAVQFGLRHDGKYLNKNSILKVRYSVTWFDDCNRRIKLGSDSIDGVVLNPQQVLTVQLNAMQDQATRAVVNIYVEK